jgi:hypothetical protein
MAINAYSVNVPIRESRNTYVPLPFQEMYAAMQEKQKRYDAAEQFERESKKAITALTSPIAEHNQYLSTLKKNYLQQAMQLHNTIVDKGSAEYGRRMQDIVDSVVADPNYNLIQESNTAWQERAKIITQQMAEGKYSPAADAFYKNFKGINEDGTLKKFIFAGLRAKVDWQKDMGEAAKAVPDEDQETTYYNPKTATMESIIIKGKNPKKVAYNISSSLSSEAKQDMMWDLQITDPKQLEKVIEAKSVALSNPSVSRISKPEMSVLNYQLALRKEGREARKDAIEELKTMQELQGTQDTFVKPLANVNSPIWSEDVKDRINPDGTIASTGVWGFQSESKTYNEDPNIGNILKNVKTLRSRGISTLSEKEALLRYRNGAKTNLQVHGFTKVQDSKDALYNLVSNQTEVTIYDVNGNISAPLTDDEKTAVFAGITSDDKKEKMQGYVSGVVNSFNPFGSKAYQIILNGKTYIATMPDANPLAQQEHEIAKAFSRGSFAELDSYQEVDRNGKPTGKIITGKSRVYVDPNDPYKRLVEKL